MSWKEHLREGISQLTALRLFDYGAAGPDLARLDCNELALAPTPDEMETFVRALREVAVHRYPDVSGLPLRAAVLSLHESGFRVQVVAGAPGTAPEAGTSLRTGSIVRLYQPR